MAITNHSYEEWAEEASRLHALHNNEADLLALLLGEHERVRYPNDAIETLIDMDVLSGSDTHTERAKDEALVSATRYANEFGFAYYVHNAPIRAGDVLALVDRCLDRDDLLLETYERVVALAVQHVESVQDSDAVEESVREVLRRARESMR